MTTDLPPYLSQVLPRFYEDVLARLAKVRPDLAHQMPHLYISGRCPCGGASCVQFYCESARTDGAPLAGRRPIYFDVQGGPAEVIVGIAGGNILTGFEVASDYPEGDIAAGLEGHGFPRGFADEDFNMSGF